MITDKLTQPETFTQIPGQLIAKIGQLAHHGLRKSCEAIGLGDGVTNIVDTPSESLDIIDVDEPLQTAPPVTEVENVHYLKKGGE